MTTIGERIHNLRTKKGLSLAKLGELSGISKGALSSYENNKYEPAAKLLVSLSEALDTTLDYLVNGEQIVILDRSDDDDLPFTHINFSEAEYELIRKFRLLNDEEKIRIDERITVMTESKGGTSSTSKSGEKIGEDKVSYAK